MKWFQGSIAEAVAASKSKKAVFVVFVEGKDDASKEVAKTLDSTEVSSRLESEKFVVIKLLSDSANYTFFAQIYQLVPVPSIFFIGENGTPLEILGNLLSPLDLATKIDSILEKAYPQANSSANLINAEAAHSSSNTQEAGKSASSDLSGTPNKLESSDISGTPNKSESSDVSETTKDSTSNNQTTDSSTNASEEQAMKELSQDEKVRRARELIELQNKKKAEEEERIERERELERRKMGKDVQKLRKIQQEKDIIDAQRERMREKAAEAAAKEKILKQIAEDKLERKRKYDMQNQEKTSQLQKKAQEEAQARARVAATADNSKTRIQFKMPTGNSITGTFDSSSTLGHLRKYVRENAQLSYQQFGMSSFFPRKDFTSADDDKNLIDLDLVPSAVILILPVKSNNPASVIESANSPGIFSHFLWTLLAPVISIYNYIMGYFGGRPRGDASTGYNENRNPQPTFGDNATVAFGRVANMATRRLNAQSAKIRAQGNIHTLHSGNDDNDENNTWNGNSTQQM